MDPGGLVLAIFCSFNNIVEDIHLIQLGQQFATDYQICLVKLTNTQIRLTRWAKSVDVANGITSAEQLQSRQTALTRLKPFENRQQAKDSLEQIELLLHKAKAKTSEYGELHAESSAGAEREKKHLHIGLKNFAPQKQAQPSSGRPFQPSSIQDREVQAVCETMSELSIRRQKETSFMKKVKWVLIAKDGFEKMINEAAELTKQLEELFPGDTKQRQAMANEEATELANSKDVQKLFKELTAVAKLQDKMLHDAIKNQSKTTKSGTGETVFNTNYNAPNNGSSIFQSTFTGDGLHLGATVTNVTRRRGKENEDEDED